MLDIHSLPTVNACLNGLSTVLLLVGFALIRARKIAAHRACMIAAFVSSTLFLISYLIYHWQVGSVRFSGTGGVRTLYLTILATHTALAALVPFLAFITLRRAWRSDFLRHRAIARITLPVWLYVSITGIVVYVMLYRMTWS
ncbi:MAG: DUF420 domain-containing protein [Acidobacteriota bacterium]